MPPREPFFTDRQLDLMNILWDEGSATVREVKEQIEEDLAYTSVLTVFQTLEKNGHVDYEPEGKAYRYFPTVSREEAGRWAVRYLLQRLFDGSPRALMDALADQAGLREEVVAEIRGAAGPGGEP